MRFEEVALDMIEQEAPSMWESACGYLDCVPSDERARGIAEEVLISGLDNTDLGIWEDWFREFSRNSDRYPAIDIVAREDLAGMLYYAQAIDPDTGAVREGSDILVGAKFQQPGDVYIDDVADGVAALLYEISARTQEILV